MRSNGSDSSAAPVISIDGLTKKFNDVTALDSVSLEINRGDILGLLGPSGCGKTTMLRCVAGLEEPTSGTITINSTVVYSSALGVSVPPEKRRLGMVFQSYALWPHFTALHNVRFGLEQMKLPRGECDERSLDALKAVELEHVSSRYPFELSGGQQQRIAVARAIAMRPDVLLFDEPLSNLDSNLRNDLRIQLKSLLRRLDATAIYVTHDQIEAMALCDRIAVMNGGAIKQLDTPETVYHRPSSKFVADFVGRANIVPVRLIEPVSVHVAEEGTLQIPRESILSSGVTDGSDEGWLAIRPEDISLLPSNRSPKDGLVGQVVEMLYMGPYVEYLIKLHNNDLLLRSHARSGAINQGDHCVVGINWSETWWLDK